MDQERVAVQIQEEEAGSLFMIKSSRLEESRARPLPLRELC